MVQNQLANAKFVALGPHALVSRRETHLEDIDIFKHRLSCLAQEFEDCMNRPPRRADIDANAEWANLFNALRDAERLAATLERREGGCKVYIARRRRFCSHAAAGGMDVCSEHHAAASEKPISKTQPAALSIPDPGNALSTTLSADAPDDVTASQQGSLGSIKSAEEQPDLACQPDPGSTGWSTKRNLGRRMKHCSNPLASQHLVAFVPPDWGQVYKEPGLPLLLDIGCAKGRWVERLSTCKEFEVAHGGRHNFLGVELFAPLVALANERRDAAGITNLHYLAASINVILPALVASLPSSSLSKVCIQFPDPWRSDGRHAARRVLTPLLAQQLAEALPCGGECFLVSDVREMAEDMRATMLLTGAFKLHELHEAVNNVGNSNAGQYIQKAGVDEPVRYSELTEHATQTFNGIGITSVNTAIPSWLPARPYKVPTERDLVCEAMWRPIYRTLLVRC